jgi:hypothetical protein
MTPKEKARAIKLYIGEVIEFTDAEREWWQAEQMLFKLIGDSHYQKNGIKRHLSQYHRLGVAYAIQNELHKRYKLKTIGDEMRLSDMFAKMCLCEEFVNLYRSIKYHFDKQFGII